MESSNATSACSVVGENDNDHGFVEILRPKTLASPLAQSGEAIPTAHPRRTVAAPDSRPSGQGSTGLFNETHFQDEKTILDDQRPARGANSDGSFHEVITRSGDGDGLASGMEGVVNDAKATEGNSQQSNASGNGAIPDMEEMVLPDNVGNWRIVASAQTDRFAGEPKNGKVSRQGASVRTPLPAAAFAGNLPLTREQSSPLGTLPDKLLPSEQDKEAALWLKSLLPSVSHGWWDVAANGKGFVIKQRWRNKGQQTQTYPRVSREQFTILQERDIEDAKGIIEDKIIGHIEEGLCDRSAERRTRAGCAAERLGFKH